MIPWEDFCLCCQPILHPIPPRLPPLLWLNLAQSVSNTMLKGWGREEHGTEQPRSLQGEPSLLWSILCLGQSKAPAPTWQGSALIKSVLYHP